MKNARTHTQNEHEKLLTLLRHYNLNRLRFTPAAGHEYERLAITMVAVLCCTMLCVYHHARVYSSSSACFVIFISALLSLVRARVRSNVVLLVLDGAMK